MLLAAVPSASAVVPSAPRTFPAFQFNIPHRPSTKIDAPKRIREESLETPEYTQYYMSIAIIRLILCIITPMFNYSETDTNPPKRSLAVVPSKPTTVARVNFAPSSPAILRKAVPRFTISLPQPSSTLNTGTMR